LLHGVVGARALNTFSGYVETLRGPVTRALRDLQGKAPDGVDARDWQKFLANHHVHSALGHTEDRVLVERLAQRTGRLSSRELAEFERRSLAEASVLERAHRDALARFGKDRGIYAPDAQTFVVELEAPLPYFRELMTFYSTSPVPRWVVEKPGNENDWFLPQKIVSNGPFTLHSWKVNDRIRLKKSESYWNHQETRSRSIDLYPTENLATALNLYLTGQLDWLPKSYPEDLA